MTTARPSARARLLDAADRLFYAEGVHTVGIDRIIAEAGVAKGSLFYNFSGKEELVAAYLAGRDERRRARIERYCEGLTDPVERLVAVFDALEEAAGEPGYRGCAFANASAEAGPDSVEAAALRSMREWLADRLRVLYDGAVASAQLDGRPAAVRMAREMAELVLATAPRSAR
jgi:AcrR family transcriptional regulator